jgi:hypothetical protein
MGVDDSEIAEQEMKLHDPEGIAAQVSPDATCRDILLILCEFLLV